MEVKNNPAGCADEWTQDLLKIKPLSLHIVRTTLLSESTQGKKMSHFLFISKGKCADLLQAILPITVQQRREEEEVERRFDMKKLEIRG